MEFVEKQRLSLWWIYVLLAIESIIVLSVLFLGKDKLSFGELKSLYFVPVLAVLLPFPLVYVLTRSAFTLIINETGITYHYWPFARHKTILWMEMSHVYMRKYDAFSEYGGWGFRNKLWFKWNDKAYIFNDKVLGLQIELIDDKKILFSTGKIDELSLFLLDLKRTKAIGAIENDVRER